MAKGKKSKAKESPFHEIDVASFERFKDVVPKNRYDWFGSVVMYDAEGDDFYNIAFGSGDNLDSCDVAEGYDDYIMVDRYELDGTMPCARVVACAVDDGYVDECTEGLREVDGGQLLLKRREWTNGDIRRFIMEAMEFAGYDATELKTRFRYVTYIASHG